MVENLLLSPGFWIAIGFVVVVFIIVTKGRGAVLNSSYERIERITDKIRTVEQLREDAQVMLQDQEKKYREVAEEMKQFVEHTHQESATILKQAQNRTNQVIETAKNRSADAILRAQVDATSQIKTVALTKAISAINEVLKSPQVAEQIVDNALEDIKGIK